MNNVNEIFENSKLAILEGKHDLANELLKKAASMGHFGATEVLKKMEFHKALTKKFPINPLSIVDEVNVNQSHSISDLVKLFEQDISIGLGRLQHLNNGLIPDEVVELLVYQTLTYYIEYKNNADILPLPVVYELRNQVKKAFLNVYIDSGYMYQIVDDYECKVIEAIWEVDIIQETESFMARLDDKFFM